MEFVRVKPIGLPQLVLGVLLLVWALITPRKQDVFWFALFMTLVPGPTFLVYGLLRMALPHRVQVAPDRVVIVSRLRTRRELLRTSLQVALVPVPTWARLTLEMLVSGAVIAVGMLLAGGPPGAAAAAAILVPVIYGVRIGLWRRKERLILRGKDERGREHTLRLTTSRFDRPWTLCTTLLAAGGTPLPA